MDHLKDRCLLVELLRNYSYCEILYMFLIKYIFRHHLRVSKSSVHQGLIGCFRGLVVNEEILDIYSYMSVHLSEIIKDCKPSCVPNPCKNGAQCKELWSTFECVCPNRWAYKGDFCEESKSVVNCIIFTIINDSFRH